MKDGHSWARHQLLSSTQDPWGRLSQRGPRPDAGGREPGSFLWRLDSRVAKDQVSCASSGRGIRGQTATETASYRGGRGPQDLRQVEPKPLVSLSLHSVLIAGQKATRDHPTALVVKHGQCQRGARLNVPPFNSPHQGLQHSNGS